ncbi:MAG TPA: YdeI/OmpD-associated family protein [Phototrophicaceae bacterium]|nr:YdeI/OmpD-associated family protein [Phototrophicaceae bacterium]
MEIHYFASPAEFRAWLEANFDTATEVQVGYWKKSTGKPSLTWPESVDQALCFGWIDGVRKSVDADSYTIRFTPRKPTSIWSQVNIRRVEELSKLGLMQPSGLAIFEARDEAKTNQYSFEREEAQFSAEQEATFKGYPKAWEFFWAQPPSYRKPAIWWVVSAKQEATQQKRMATLIEDSENGRRIAPLRRPGKDK